jgi:hypothetical protein
VITAHPANGASNRNSLSIVSRSRTSAILDVSASAAQVTVGQFADEQA